MEIPGHVRNILDGKNPRLLTIGPDRLVFDAVKVMGEEDIGALVVVEDDRVIGIVSERDYSRKIVLHGRTSRDTKVREVLSEHPLIVGLDDTVEECMRLMTGQRVRHLPVVENDKLIGVVSIGDLVNWIILTQRDTIEQLHGYIAGRYPM